MAGLETQDVNGAHADRHKRPLAHFPPDIWGDRFVNFTQQDLLMMESYTKEIEPLKEEVKIMLMDKFMDPTKKMSLIDTMERVGVSYYFENEINELLNQIFEAFAANNFKDFDLYNTSLQFRIFRQHGFAVPCDVFSKFTDDEGKFKETLKSDVRGMVSLYEAAHLRIHDESILDEALAFTTSFLMNSTIAMSSKLARHALKQAMHLGIQRVEIRHAISFYEEDESPNVTLQHFSKIDYNRLQLLYRQELSEILRWWNESDIVAKFPYGRHRCVEIHFWSIAMYFEPQYSYARKLFSKTLILATVLDDTYDAYGTFEELQLLTQVLERWDLSAIDDLPANYMKFVVDFVINTCDEFEKEMTKKEKPYAAQFIKDLVLELIRSYFLEVKWLKENYVPTFEEYMVNARITAGSRILVAGSMMGMEEIIDAKTFEQLLQHPKAVRASEVIIRLMDDVVGHQEEQARGHVASGVECYMKEFNKSREEVAQIFKKMVEDAWKDLNEEFLTKPNSHSENDLNLPLPVLRRVFNYARVMDALYKVIDGFIYSAKVIKDDILEVYTRSIPI